MCSNLHFWFFFMHHPSTSYTSNYNIRQRKGGRESWRRRDCIHYGNLDFLLQIWSQQRTHVQEDCKVLMLSPALYTRAHTHKCTQSFSKIFLFFSFFGLESCESSSESSSGTVADWTNVAVNLVLELQI